MQRWKSKSQWVSEVGCSEVGVIRFALEVEVQAGKVIDSLHLCHPGTLDLASSGPGSKSSVCAQGRDPLSVPLPGSKMNCIWLEVNQKFL